MPTEVNNFVTCPECGHYCPRNGPHTCPPLAAETFPRGPSNEQTLLTELGQVKRQLAEIKEIDARMCLDYSTMVEELAEVRGWKEIAEEQLRRVITERDKLQAFKDWCHSYLDAHGVPHHPPGPHGAAGCRIGDRMDWLMAKLANAEQAVDHIAAEDRAERDALAVTAERLKDWLALALANTYDMGMTTEDRRKLAEAEVFLKETAP